LDARVDKAGKDYQVAKKIDRIIAAPVAVEPPNRWH